LPGGFFVFTSNVDGQFQKAGFPEDRIVECHGSIHHLQCSRPCHRAIWSADTTRVTVDEDTFRAEPPLPSCPACAEVARPNILMFGDWAWIPDRSAAQETRFESWLDRAGPAGLVIVEIGAGSAVPTVRMLSERTAARTDATLIRINPREPQVPRGHVGLALSAMEALSDLGLLGEATRSAGLNPARG
jgi:NAD-dependent SIR2 family protein deacetylase